MKIAMTSVFVDSPADAFVHYTEVLGFVERMFVPEAQLAIVVSPEAPEGVGLLLEPNANPIAKTYQQALYDAGLPAIVFSTEDANAEYARLSARGVVFRSKPQASDYGVQATFEDGCGNLILLHQG